jgi:hypothetical protein
MARWGRTFAGRGHGVGSRVEQLAVRADVLGLDGGRYMTEPDRRPLGARAGVQKLRQGTAAAVRERLTVGLRCGRAPSPASAPGDRAAGVRQLWPSPLQDTAFTPVGLDRPEFLLAVCLAEAVSLRNRPAQPEGASRAILIAGRSGPYAWA